MKEAGFEYETVRGDVEKSTGEFVNNMNLINVEGIPYFEVYTNEDKEFIVLENEEKAEQLARIRVEDDLETEPELFNKNFLQRMMWEKLDGECYAEAVSREAVKSDGFAHFLSAYDDYYEETEHGFILIRTN